MGRIAKRDAHATKILMAHRDYLRAQPKKSCEFVDSASPQTIKKLHEEVRDLKENLILSDITCKVTAKYVWSGV